MISQFSRYREWQTETGSYGSFFALLPSPLKKIRILKKWKKIAGDIIILHKCTKNHNHMRYSSWDMEWDRQNFWSFAFIPPNNQKDQTFKTMKKVYRHVITLHMCTKNHNQMMYAFWDMEYDRPNFLLFWAIFCPFTPLLTPQIKIWNKFKKTLEILSYYTCVP